MASIHLRTYLQGHCSEQGHSRKLWPVRSRLRASCREGGAGAALPRVMRTCLAASAQVASVALPTITRSAMARKRKFDAALGSVSAKQLTAVSLFCGAGGMDVGFNRAAFKTIWAADKNSAACATYNRYAQQEIALRRDLAKEDFKKLRQQLACTPDCVFGGPPCQGFSQAGKMIQTDARNGLINVFLDVVEELRPRCFVMENAKNLHNKRRFRALLDALVQPACREAGIFMRNKSRKLQRLRCPAGQGASHLRRFLARREVAPPEQVLLPGVAPIPQACSDKRRGAQDPGASGFRHEPAGQHG